MRENTNMTTTLSLQKNHHTLNKNIILYILLFGSIFIILLSSIFLLLNIHNRQIQFTTKLTTTQSTFFQLQQNETAYAEAQQQKTTQFDKFKRSAFIKTVPLTYLEEKLSSLQKELNISTIKMQFSDIKTIKENPWVQKTTYNLQVFIPNENILLTFLNRIQKETPGIIIFKLIELDINENQNSYHTSSNMTLLHANTSSDSKKTHNNLQNRLAHVSLDWIFRPNHKVFIEKSAQISN